MLLIQCQAQIAKNKFKGTERSEQMKKILNFINDTNMGDKTEKIINGEIDHRVIYEEVVEFNALKVEEKQLYMIRLTERISRIKKPHKLLTILLLLDHIQQCNPNLTFPRTFATNLQYDLKKQSIILINLISYYHYFIKCNITNRFNVETINPQDEFTEAYHFCKISLGKITEFLKICFAFEEGILQLQQHKFLIKSIVKSILLRFRNDLDILNLFIKNNLEIILQKTVKHPYVFKINYVYEKVIFINKSMKKLQDLSKLIQSQIDFPKFEVNIEVNREVEIIMKERREKEPEFFDYATEKELIHDCYISEQRSIHTTESFLLLDE